MPSQTPADGDLPTFWQIIISVRQSNGHNLANMTDSASKLGKGRAARPFPSARIWTKSERLVALAWGAGGASRVRGAAALGGTRSAAVLDVETSLRIRDWGISLDRLGSSARRRLRLPKEQASAMLDE